MPGAEEKVLPSSVTHTSFLQLLSILLLVSLISSSLNLPLGLLLFFLIFIFLPHPIKKETFYFPLFPPHFRPSLPTLYLLFLSLYSWLMKGTTDSKAIFLKKYSCSGAKFPLTDRNDFCLLSGRTALG